MTSSFQESFFAFVGIWLSCSSSESSLGIAGDSRNGRVLEVDVMLIKGVSEEGFGEGMIGECGAFMMNERP